MCEPLTKVHVIRQGSGHLWEDGSFDFELRGILQRMELDNVLMMKPDQQDRPSQLRKIGAAAFSEELDGNYAAWIGTRVTSHDLVSGSANDCESEPGFATFVRRVIPRN